MNSTNNGVASLIFDHTNRTYRADGTVTGVTLGNGLSETRTYDTQSRVTNIKLNGIENRDYSYDANGNVTQIDKPTEGRLYDYDVLDRITDDAKLNTGTIKDYTYQYDENGNRTQRIGRNYQYEPNTNKLIKDGSVDITRDASGNALNYPGDRTFTYNDAGRLRTVTKTGTLKVTYTYNAHGQRTRKDIPNKNSQVFHYDLNGNLIMRSIQTGKPIEDYIWVDGELRQFTTLKGKNNGSINTEKVKTYITTDHLLTPRLGTNNTQTLTWRWDSDAFNIKRPNNNPDGDTTKVNLQIGFPGQYYDTESTLYYNWNRYYDRQSGRYVTSDPIGLDGGLNTFAYVYANPILLFDSKGLKAEVRCRRLGNPSNPSFRSDVATFFGGQHCFINLSCQKGGIPETNISYLGNGSNVASGNDSNNDTVYSDQGRYISIPVTSPPDKECGEKCAFEKCLISKAGAIGSGQRIKGYSIFGPNSNTFVQNLITSCGGNVKDFFGEPYGWDHGDIEYE